VFTFDYIGALVASLLFPLVLVPHLGLVRSSFLFGALNVLVALATLRLLRESAWERTLQTTGLLVLAGLATGFVFSDHLMAWSEKSAYVDTVIFARSTPYQRIVLTREANDLRLYLNGNLQFSSRDEYRYHEALVHPGLARVSEARNLLVLGGGDGLAVREALKYPGLTNIVLVDLDPEMTRLFSTQEMLLRLNESSPGSTTSTPMPSPGSSPIPISSISSSPIFQIRPTSRWASFIPQPSTLACVQRCDLTAQWSSSAPPPGWHANPFGASMRRCA
jgi:spermidine synthase